MKFSNYFPSLKAIKFGIALTLNAIAASYATYVFTAANTRFGFVFTLAAFSKTGLILIHGGQVGLQKSTIRPGEF